MHRYGDPKLFATMYQTRLPIETGFGETNKFVTQIGLL